jgi:omega-6 fatty acid desaturase (delta-12 desaturase)
MVLLVGPWQFAAIHLPIIVLAASIGVWLFYVQHQFENTMWARNENWLPHEAALYGSSYYELPKVLHWFTANIGMHHIHHLCSRVPYYRLPQILRAHPALESVGRVTLLQSLRNVRLTLWDESGQRLIAFRNLEGLQKE